MMDFYERPKYVDFLFSKILEQRLFQARRMAQAGVDLIRMGDDIATQTSLIVGPQLYRERIKPFHAAVIRAVREIDPKIRMQYHSDGALTPLLPDLVDIGISVINPVQPECMDLRTIKKDFGRDLVLWGCMPVQSLFVHGSATEVSEYLDFFMREIAPGGGVVAEFTNFIATEKSKENLRTFFELFYEKGKY
jgi:uroporphyrinogen decarboxylase